LLGNSGSTASGLHLFFHVADPKSELVSGGFPDVFEHFEVAGVFDNIGAIESGQ
jgi:hypothetical protein